jgi:hypothetical protein
MGTVLLIATTFGPFAALAMASATAITAVRSAAPEWSIGVPTAITQISAAFTAASRSVVNRRRFSSLLRRTSSSSPGS